MNSCNESLCFFCAFCRIRVDLLCIFHNCLCLISVVLNKIHAIEANTLKLDMIQQFAQTPVCSFSFIRSIWCPADLF